MPVLVLNQPGKTEAKRFDNALRRIFSVSKEELLKREASGSASKQRSRLGNRRLGVPMRWIALAVVVVVLLLPGFAAGQEYSVRAVDAENGKSLKGIPITLRYNCTYTGAGINIKAHCQFIQRKTGSDGLAHFPEAGSLHNIDDIFSLPIEYGAVCCDIRKPEIPGIGTIKFKHRTVSEMMHWIFVGD